MSADETTTAPPTAPPQAESEDTDSAISVESPPTSTDSVPSEAEDYIEENGRVYHANWIPRRYLLPNDEQEQERLMVQHEILLKTDSLHKAILPKGLHRVLDVGTGTGEWAIAFVEKYPGAIVDAIDISPNVMPTLTHPNCTFLLQDVEEDIGLGNNKYDYVHVRLINGLCDWDRFITNAFAALTPGAYVEIKEFEFPLRFHDPDMAVDSALMTWSTILIEGALRLGIDLTIADKIPTMLKDTGFENVESSTCAWPIGTWPKKTRREKLGASLQRYWLETLQAFAWRPFQEMGWLEEETQCLLAKARTEIYCSQIRASMHVCTFWARKPYIN